MDSIENNTNTHYADYYEGYKYLEYDDTYMYYMELVERVGGFEQVTFSILAVVIQDELERCCW